MFCSFIRLFCQFRFVYVQTLNDSFRFPHYTMVVLKSKSHCILVSVLSFWALLLFHSNWPLSNIFFFLKLEKQFDSLSQVAAIVHNDFYHLSQEILGLAFQVCMPNLLLLVSLLILSFAWRMLVCSCLKMQICNKLFILYLPCIKLCCTVILYFI